MSYLFRLMPLRPKAVAFTLVALCLASAAVAQQYQVDTIDENARRAGLKFKQWLADPATYAADKANFTNYFQKFYFPAMTRSSQSDLAELGKLRLELFKKFLWATSNEELQRDLSRMAYDANLRVAANLKELKPKAVVANPPYHPAVRYNAILVVGLLDDPYAIDGGANPRPPRPYQKATAALTTIVDRATTSSQFPPSVILGALVGLERHAKYHANIDPAAVEKMSAALLKLVNHDKPIQDMDADAYAWLRLRAASALANLGSVGQNNAVNDALVTLMGKFKSIDDRCSTADLLDQINYKDTKIDGPAATSALVKLASDLSVAETKRAQDFERVRLAGGYAPGERITSSDESEKSDPYPRAHVLARLVKLQTGLHAVKDAVPEDSQKKIDAIDAAITPVIEAASDDDTISLRVARTIRTMSDEIAAIAGPADEAAEGDEGFSAPAPAAAADAATAEAPDAAAPAADAPAAEAPAAVPPAAAADEASN